MHYLHPTLLLHDYNSTLPLFYIDIHGKLLVSTTYVEVRTICDFWNIQSVVVSTSSSPVAQQMMMSTADLDCLSGLSCQHPSYYTRGA